MLAKEVLPTKIRIVENEERNIKIDTGTTYNAQNPAINST